MAALYTLHAQGIIGFFADSLPSFRQSLQLRLIRDQLVASLSGKKPRGKKLEYRDVFPELHSMMGFD